MITTKANLKGSPLLITCSWTKKKAQSQDNQKSRMRVPKHLNIIRGSRLFSLFFFECLFKYKQSECYRLGSFFVFLVVTIAYQQKTGTITSLFMEKILWEVVAATHLVTNSFIRWNHKERFQFFPLTKICNDHKFILQSPDSSYEYKYSTFIQRTWQ